MDLSKRGIKKYKAIRELKKIGSNNMEQDYAEYCRFTMDMDVCPMNFTSFVAIKKIYQHYQEKDKK